VLCANSPGYPVVIKYIPNSKLLYKEMKIYRKEKERYKKNTQIPLLASLV
jgi:hypothetical protein